MIQFDAERYDQEQILSRLAGDIRVGIINVGLRQQEVVIANGTPMPLNVFSLVCALHAAGHGTSCKQSVEDDLAAFWDKIAYGYVEHKETLALGESRKNFAMCFEQILATLDPESRKSANLLPVIQQVCALLIEPTLF